MNFRTWFEAKLDPSILSLYKWNPSGDKPHIGASYNLKIDQGGNIVPLDEKDWEQRIPHFELIPRAKEVRLQRLSPISPEFRKFISALRSKYGDIDNWNVTVFSQAGHMQTGRRTWDRSVRYWMQQPSVDLVTRCHYSFITVHRPIYGTLILNKRG